LLGRPELLQELFRNRTLAIGEETDVGLLQTFFLNHLDGSPERLLEVGTAACAAFGEFEHLTGRQPSLRVGLRSAYTVVEEYPAERPPLELGIVGERQSYCLGPLLLRPFHGLGTVFADDHRPMAELLLRLLAAEP